MRRRGVSSLVAVLLLPMLWPALALAQQPKAGVVTAVQGRATFARPVLPQPVQVKLKDDVFLQDRISTRENSVVRVLLGGKALVTVRELSVFTVTEEPGRAVVDLQSGKLAVAAARSLMKPGESIEIRTPNAIAAVRGSLGVISTRAVGNKPFTELAVLDGEFTVTHRGSHLPPVVVVGGFLFTMLDDVVDQFRRLTRTEMATYESQTGGRSDEHSQRAAAGDEANRNSVDATTQLFAALVDAGFTGGALVTDLARNAAPTGLPVPSPSGEGGTHTPLPIEAPATPLPIEVTPPPPPPTGTTTLITFDPEFPSLPSGVTLQYFSGGKTGVLFALPTTNTVPLTSTRSAIDDVGNALLLNGLSLGSTANFGLLVTFATPQKTVSAVGADFGGDPVGDNEIVHLTAFDSSGAVIGSSTFSSPFAVPNLKPVSFTSPAKNIKFVAFTWEVDLGFYTVDNIEFVDPPFFPNFTGASFTTTSTAPLTELSYGAVNTVSDLVFLDQGSSLTMGGPLLIDTGSTFKIGGRFVSVRSGSALTSTSGDPLIRLNGSTATTGLEFFGLAGSTTGVDAETGLTLGTDKPLQHGGTLLETSGATISSRKAMQVDTALLEASAPLLNLTGGSQFTTSLDALDLSYRAKVTSLGPLFSLDASTLTVRSGALINLASEAS